MTSQVSDRCRLGLLGTTVLLPIEEHGTEEREKGEESKRNSSLRITNSVTQERIANRNARNRARVSIALGSSGNASSELKNHDNKITRQLHKVEDSIFGGKIKDVVGEHSHGPDPGDDASSHEELKLGEAAVAGSTCHRCEEDQSEQPFDQAEDAIRARQNSFEGLATQTSGFALTRLSLRVSLRRSRLATDVLRTLLVLLWILLLLWLLFILLWILLLSILLR